MPLQEKVLFVCTYNMSRSRTAEVLFEAHPRVEALSAGTHRTAVVQVSEELVAWADRIIVMEDHHRQTLAERFPTLVAEKPVICLAIPDEYMPLADDLKAILRERLAGYDLVPDP